MDKLKESINLTKEAYNEFIEYVKKLWNKTTWLGRIIIFIPIVFMYFIIFEIIFFIWLISAILEILYYDILKKFVFISGKKFIKLISIPFFKQENKKIK